MSGLTQELKETGRIKGRKKRHVYDDIVLLLAEQH